MSRGGTVIVDPYGEVLAGPLYGKEGILVAEIDPRAVRAARREFDPVGHYARPDVFTLTVDVGERPPARFVDSRTATTSPTPPTPSPTLQWGGFTPTGPE